MGFIIGLLTAFMVMDCLILILLVLMQLPKKEAGAGLAFGAGATDALFGAGSGNFLTKATKYAAIFFFCAAVLLSLMENNRARQPGSAFRRSLEEQQKQAAQPPAPAPGPTVAPGGTNFPVLNMEIPPAAVPATNPAAAAPTNAAPVPQK